MVGELDDGRPGISSSPTSRQAGWRARAVSTFESLANLFAMSGGIGFLLLVLMSIISIVRRKLGWGALDGDIELMQIGTAVFAAAFMPLCTIANEHLRVEFFTEGASVGFRKVLDDLADGVLAAIFLVLAWRTLDYALSLRSAGEVTTLLSIPMWIPVILIVPPLIMAGLCAIANMVVGRRETEIEGIVQ